MTRQEFDNRFAATQDTTEGYSDTAIAEINDAVFAMVRELDTSDDATKSIVDYHMSRVMSERA